MIAEITPNYSFHSEKNQTVLSKRIQTTTVAVLSIELNLEKVNYVGGVYTQTSEVQFILKHCITYFIIMLHQNNNVCYKTNGSTVISCYY